MKRIKVKNYRAITLSLLLGSGLVVLSLVLARPPASKAATPITVNSTGDAGDANLSDGICETAPGNGVCTLRAAIQQAASGDTINFNIRLRFNDCFGAACTITLTSSELLINKNLTINGPGANLLTVQRSTASGTPDFRIFDIAQPNINVTISGITITNGNVPGTQGGGIYTSGILTLTGCTISGNSAGDGGGGIVNESAALTITNSTVSNNSANVGGGITNFSTATITNSTISDNTATSSNSLI